jgi:hypothetical protein
VHLDIIKVLSPTDAQENCFKRSIKIYIRTAPTVLTTVTLASSYSALPDDGDYTETCWNCFDINFNTSFKAIQLCISW